MLHGRCPNEQVYRWPGSEYRGGVLDGRRHGLGRMHFANSESVYEGDWVQGLRHGSGTLTLNIAGTHKYQGEKPAAVKGGMGS